MYTFSESWISFNVICILTKIFRMLNSCMLWTEFPVSLWSISCYDQNVRPLYLTTVFSWKLVITNKEYPQIILYKKMLCLFRERTCNILNQAWWPSFQIYLGEGKHWTYLLITVWCQKKLTFLVDESVMTCRDLLCMIASNTIPFPPLENKTRWPKITLWLSTVTY